MSAPPWEADRVLDAELASRLIVTQFPEFSGSSFRWLGSGWDNDCFVNDEDWVFRFPRRADALPYVEKEVGAMPLINRAVSLPTPAFKHFGQATSEFPYPFYGYEKIAGEPWREGDRIDLAAFAQALGEALSQIHGISREAATGAGVPVSQWDLKDDFRELSEVATLLRDSLPADLLESWKPVLDGNVDPLRYGGPPLLVHNDLGPEHVLFDPDTGRATGMIDFGDIELGDPARDFVMFSYLFGPEFLEGALEHYPLGVDPEFRERLDLITWVRAPIWFSHAVRKGDGEDVAKHMMWLRRFAERKAAG